MHTMDTMTRLNLRPGVDYTPLALFDDAFDADKSNDQRATYGAALRDNLTLAQARLWYQAECLRAGVAPDELPA